MSTTESRLFVNGFDVGNIRQYPTTEELDYVEVVADGVKTLATLLNELYVLIDTTRLCEGSCAEIKSTNGNTILYTYNYIDRYLNIYCSMSVVTSGAETNTLTLKSTGSTRKSAIGNSVTDESSSVFDSGTTVRFYYNDTKTLEINTKAENCIYDNTSSGFAATDVQSAIDKIVTKDSVSVTADGVKTYSTLLIDLYQLIESSVNSNNIRDSFIMLDSRKYYFCRKESGELFYNTLRCTGASVQIEYMRIRSSDAQYGIWSTDTNGTLQRTDYSINVPSAGTMITLYF